MNILRKATILSLLFAYASVHLLAQTEAFTKYLFVYFPSNANENIYYALSDNGYDYTPMNDGQMIISADTISLKKGVRDPHILRGEDGYFYMVLTDMRSAEGWESNHGIVMMKSKDLVNWTHSTVHFPDKYKEKNYANVIRVWAPETIWDPQAKKYMVYFSLLTNDGTIPYDKVFYCYANEDFTDLEGDPIYLYDRGSATIDMDIVYNEKDGLYHAFYKNEGSGGICKVTASTLTAHEGQPGSQWSEPSETLQQTNEAVEGAGIFKLIDSDTWVLMYDCYMNGHYQFCTSTDLTNFTFKQNTETSGMFTPRHGTVIPVTDAEIEAINLELIERQKQKEAEELQLLKEQLTLEVERAQQMGVDVTSVQQFLQQEAFTKEGIQEASEALNVNEFNAIFAIYKEEKTSLIKNTWKKVSEADNKGQHWDDTGTSIYYEQTGSNWGSSAWQMSMTQQLQLPAGYYVLKASGRSASDAVVATMSVDDMSVRFPTKGDVGYGITTDGRASFDPAETYANGGQGRGWEWRYLPFYLEKESTITLTLAGRVENAVHQWMSISNLSLLYSAENPTAVTLPAASSTSPRIYNLAGQALSHSRSGVHIIQSAGKTEKVLIK